MRINMHGCICRRVFAKATAQDYISDNSFDSYRPDAAVERSNGNFHIVWAEDTAEIWYSLFDENGTTLIDQTKISTNGDAIHPKIAVGSDGRAYVTYIDGRDMFLAILNPADDDQDGDAADPVELVDDEIIIGDGDDIEIWDNNPGHMQILIDAADNLHIVVQVDCGTDPPLYYLQLDSEGAVNVDYRQFGTTNCHATQSISLDADGNIHVAWSADHNTINDEIYYAMLDGVTGADIIAETLVTDDDGYRGKHTGMAVVDNMVTIIWGDNRLRSPADSQSGTTDDEEIYLMRLDPSLDDQNGDAADVNVIKVVDDVQITTTDDTVPRWYITAQLTPGDGLINVAWQEAGSSSAGDVGTLRVDVDGVVSVAQSILTSAGTGTTYNPYIAHANGIAIVAIDDAGTSRIAYFDIGGGSTDYPLPLLGTSGNEIPVITSDGGGDTANVNAAENQTSVTTVTYTDADMPADTISFSLSGADAGLFSISASGVLTFDSAPDFENPGDADSDGDYEVTVEVNDGNGGIDTQDITVSVTNESEGEGGGESEGEFSGKSRNSFGCTVGTGGKPDPTLPLLIAASLLYMTRRKWIPGQNS